MSGSPAGADRVLEEAQGRSYRYPGSFVGFSARVRVETGPEAAEGVATVRLDGGKVAVEL